jgi:hypothetical protein
MIRFSDAVTLATTKLRTRKVRTTVTVITVSMLFAILVLAVLVVAGVTGSAKRFMSSGLSERYIANLQIFGGYKATETPPAELQARANQIYDQLVADKKAEAKRLGIEYDPTTEPKPITGNQGEVSLNQDSPAAVQALKEYQATHPSAREKLQQAAQTYHPKAIYPLTPSTVKGTLKSMKDGKEDFASSDQALAGGMTTPDLESGWQYLDGSVTQPFLLNQSQLDAQRNATDIPIIAPYSKAEAALGLSKLPANASSKERLDRITYVRDHAASTRFTLCYRNEVSQMQIGEAINAAKQIEQNKDNKDYQKQSLVYGLPPADSCSAAPVIRDVRSSAEKALTDKQNQFAAKFGTVVDPAQEKVSFRVVGLSPDPIGADGFSSIDLLVSSVAGSTLQGSWVVPQDLYDALPDTTKATYAKFADRTPGVSQPSLHEGLLVEFSSASEIKNYMAKEGCTGFDCSEKPYISYFGSNSVLIQDITSGATQVLSVIALVIAAIAALIMMGMIGRVISDSRRETAVFRAIGAKRNDIRAIYSTYTFFLSLGIVATTLAIGTAIALWINNSWSSDATVQAQLVFINADSSQQFHLIGIWWQPLLAIAGLIIVTGFVGMLLPLSRNLVRSPIKDMRDDT